MTIYWDPDKPTDPNSIDVWHVADDGTTNGPLTVDTSAQQGMPDTFGDVAPDAVRDGLVKWLKGQNWGSNLTQSVVLDMLSLDYERGTPP